MAVESDECAQRGIGMDKRNILHTNGRIHRIVILQIPNIAMCTAAVQADITRQGMCWIKGQHIVQKDGGPPAYGPGIVAARNLILQHADIGIRPFLINVAQARFQVAHPQHSASR